MISRYTTRVYSYIKKSSNRLLPPPPLRSSSPTRRWHYWYDNVTIAQRLNLRHTVKRGRVSQRTCLIFFIMIIWMTWTKTGIDSVFLQRNVRNVNVYRLNVNGFTRGKTIKTPSIKIQRERERMSCFFFVKEMSKCKNKHKINLRKVEFN